ncbi:MAG: hypothetical protein ISR58_03245 [Anaerolineales bacterium]|nr:hypothetical protein [Chloroflexota bacterium]MBL6980187.1 hypothetical protein [Anaerolineales bacterium]
MKIDNDNLSAHNTIPDDVEIVEILSNIRPKPSQNFRQRMADQPWAQSGYQPRRFRLFAQRLGVITGVIILLVLFFSLITPSLEVVAQRLIQFFLPTIGDQTVVQITLEGTTDLPNVHPLTISEAENLAGFEARMPTLLPPGYTLSGAFYHPEREAIVLNFAADTHGHILRFLQRPLSEEYQQIGASAVIETIKIGSSTGEYVTGAWTVPEVESVFEKTEFGRTIPVQATWDPNAEIQMLRWVENDMLFEIIFAGGTPNTSGYLTKLDLIAIATSMQ